MTELETYAQFALDNGGFWYPLEKSDNYTMTKSQNKYMVKHNYYYDSPVYQIFDAQGKRIFASTNYIATYEKYKRLVGGD